MAKIEFKGIEKYTKMLEALGRSSSTVIGKAIYAAAGIVTNGIRKNMDAIPVLDKEDLRHHRRNGITETAKQGLQASLGIAKMQDENGFFHVKVGFDGYNKVHTKTYPKGQPNSLIARSVESGTSFMTPHPFIAPAIRKTRNAAIQKMEAVLDEETEKIMG